MRNDFKESTGTENEVDAVKVEETPKFRKDDSSRSRRETLTKPPTRPSSNRYNRCGKSPGHARQNCPASAATCHKCSKKGHWASVCRPSPHNPSCSWLLYGSHQERRRIFIAGNICGDWSTPSSPWPSSYRDAKNCPKGQCCGSRRS